MESNNYVGETVCETGMNKEWDVAYNTGYNAAIEEVLSAINRIKNSHSAFTAIGIGHGEACSKICRAVTSLKRSGEVE